MHLSKYICVHGLEAIGNLVEMERKGLMSVGLVMFDVRRVFHVCLRHLLLLRYHEAVGNVQIFGLDLPPSS